MADSFRYTFRFCSDPGFQPQRDLADLAAFVKEARIDDVAMFVDPQDLNTGHLPLPALQPYLEYFAQVKELLGPLGATLSVNQWYSLMHEDLGQGMGDGQHFAPMVDRYGAENDACVCPADEQWQDYFAASMARWASLQPEIIWVEDDFRYHNHAPLAWGGCFCRDHMALYEKAAGQALDREEFAAAVTAPGTPHPLRAVWLDVCRQVQLQVAEKVGAAVRAASPTAKVGLMSSAPYMHATEGRHWQPLLRAFAAGAPPVDRVHLPGYVEPTPMEYMRNFNMVAMQTRHFLPPETEVYPELENYPYSRFSNSLAGTRFQLASSLPLDEKGIAMNLFDLNGNGIVAEEGWAGMLRDAKPFLNEMNGSGIFGLPKRGVRVLCSEDAAYSLHTRHTADFNALCPQEVFFAGLLPAMGIPFAYESDFDVAGQVVAAGGQVFRAMEPAQLQALFANNFILLNGDAAVTLCELGLGHLAGLQSARFMRQNSGEFTYEQAVEGAAAADGAALAPGRASSAIFCCDGLFVQYAQPPRVLSQFHNARRQPVCPAQAVVDDRVMIFPFGNLDSPIEMPPMLLNRLRQRILQGALAGALRGRGAPNVFPMVLDAPHLTPYAYADGGRRCLYLVNACNDPVDGLRLWLPEAAAGGVTVRTSGGQRQQAAFAANADGTQGLPLHLAPMETAMLEWTAES